MASLLRLPVLASVLVRLDHVASFGLSLLVFCFRIGRPFIPDQHRVWWPRSFDVLLLTAYDRSNALLEFFNGFDFALFLHFLNFDLKVTTEPEIVASVVQQSKRILAPS